MPACTNSKHGVCWGIKGNGIHLRKTPIHLRIWFSTNFISAFDDYAVIEGALLLATNVLGANHLPTGFLDRRT